jgi:hypothetical protein
MTNRGGGKVVREVVAAEFPLGGIFWSLFILYFWFMLIWIFIATFGDIFRRRDLSGWAKAGWLLLIFALPFLGILIYMAARPRVDDRPASVRPEPVVPPRYA